MQPISFYLLPVFNSLIYFLRCWTITQKKTRVRSAKMLQMFS